MRVRDGRSGRRPWRVSRGTFGWVFLAPFLLAFGFALVLPLAYAAYLSLFRDQLIGGVSFVGLDNYVAVFSDEKFWSAVRNVLTFFAIQVPVMLSLALAAALALDSGRLRGVALFRVGLYIPYAVPGVVAALIWGFIYGGDFGLVGNLEKFFGVPLPNPFASELILGSVANILTWGLLGFNMLVYYSALQTIPAELYEAARIDGAGHLRIVWHIKLPALRPAFLVTLVFAVIGTAHLFGEPFILQPSSPTAINSYFSPNIYAYTLSFIGGQYNYAAAVAIVVGSMTLVIAFGVQLLGNRRERS